MNINTNILAALLVLAGGVLAMTARGQESSYPPAAYEGAAGLPRPGEAPREYFYRQVSRTRGPQAMSNVEYEVIPQSGEAALPPPAATESFTSFNNAPPNPVEQNYADNAFVQEAPSGPTSQKPGVFQKWSWRATYIPQFSDNNLGQTDLETWVVFGLPCPTRDNPLLITPGFGARLLEGPNTLDLPGHVYDVYLQFRWLGKLNDTWGYDLVFTPGVYGDLEVIDNDTWRYMGRAVATYEWSPWVQLVFGVGYFDRENVSALPVGGFIYTNGDTRWEAIFPRPRYARRYYSSCDCEKWWYLGGEFGGGSWTYQDAANNQQIMTLTDLRLRLGLETKRNGGAGRLVEIGYVFNRQAEIAGGPTQQLGSSFMVRAGITYSAPRRVRQARSVNRCVSAKRLNGHSTSCCLSSVGASADAPRGRLCSTHPTHLRCSPQASRLPPRAIFPLTTAVPQLP